MKNHHQGFDRQTGGLAVLFIVIWLAACQPQPAPTSTVTPVPSQTPALIFTVTPSNTPSPALTSTPAFTPTPTALPSEITDHQGVAMRLVPAGPFTMGSDNGQPDEKPVHVVDLSAFYMDKYEVTNALYKACVDAGVCQLPTNDNSGPRTSAYDVPAFKDRPVIWVDWNRAKTYCEWRGARLPGEAEWEKAARGADGRTYPWGENIDKTFANYGENVDDNYNGIFGFGKTSAVGIYENGQSPYGIHDMAGNVWEWTADWYDVYPGGDPGVSGAFGQTYRVLRGGAWNTSDTILRAAFRGGNVSDMSANYIGFRCARSRP